MIKKVIIATHSFSPGTSQAFRNFCINKKIDTLFIEHALFGNIFSWFFDSIDTLYKVIKEHKKYDLYLGSNRLNTLMGIILKKINLVEKVVYFSPDWSKNRFNNKLLNSLFSYLDFFCVKNSDCVWNSSTVMKIDPMMEERLKLGYPKEWLKKQIQVSDGTDNYEIPSFDMINRFEMGFVGHLKKGMGMELVIDALPNILKKIPEIKLVIIGSGPLEKLLKKKSKNLPVEFIGFLGDLEQVYQRLSKCAIALAPYENSKENISQFSDPGKVKNYLSIGLPMIITNVPKISSEIEKSKCGIVINYKKEEFVDAVIRLLKDDKIMKKYKKNTIRLAKKYRWERIFNRALKYL